jgi:hypothetical protein
MNRDYIDSDAYLGPDYPVGCKQGKKFARGLCKKSTGAFKKVTRFSNEGSNFQDGHKIV